MSGSGLSDDLRRLGLVGTLAAIVSALASDWRGATIFQWWMPSVRATSAW